MKFDEMVSLVLEREICGVDSPIIDLTYFLILQAESFLSFR